jgi:hypothetical protein
MAIYLDSKDLKQLDQYFTKASVFKGRLSDDYDFTGMKTVRIHTILTVPMGNYTRSGANRYGTPTELEDIVQEMTMSRDRSFAVTIDKGNRLQGGGRTEAGKVMRAQLDEQGIPDYDAYVAGVLAHKGGLLHVESAAVANTNIASMIIAGNVAMDEKKVPRKNRTIYATPSTIALLRLAPEWNAIDKAAQDYLVKGKIGEFDGCDVVAVTPDCWVSGVNFMIVYKEAAVAPQQLNDTKIHQDPPGLSGDLLEGRNIYDCFIKQAKCDGIYVSLGSTETRVAKPQSSYTSGATATITCSTASSTIVWTNDGSDPRYSANVHTGGSVTGITAGMPIKAYAYKAGAWDSEVYEFVGA